MGRAVLPLYHLYIRRSDKAMQVVDVRQGTIVRASSIERNKIGPYCIEIEGYFIKIPGRVSVLLLDEEVTHCYDFPTASGLKAG